MITRFKPGVILEPSPITARLLSAVDRVSANSPYDITVTSGADNHPPGDVHTLGMALDLRSHDLDDADKSDVVRSVLAELTDEAPENVSARNGAWLALETDEWFIMLEKHKAVDEHIHVQRRKGAVPFD